MWIGGRVIFASPGGAVFDTAVIQLNNEYQILRFPRWKISSATEGIQLYVLL